MEFPSFFTAACLLLAAPGPTNTLLATSGAAIGIVRSLHLLVAELAGYLLAIALLRLALGPIMSDVPVVAAMLRVTMSAYILVLAVTLWRANGCERQDAPPVTFSHVLVTTLLNPKALVFAFLLLPLQAGLLDMLPRLVAIAGQIMAAGAAWITLGATLGRSARSLGRPDLVTRTGAVALVAVAGLIWLPSLPSA